MLQCVTGVLWETNLSPFSCEKKMVQYYTFVVPADSEDNAIKQVLESPQSFLTTLKEHVVGHYTWGKGSTLEKAYQNLIREGGKKKDAILAYKFVSTLPFGNVCDSKDVSNGEALAFVDDLGSVCWFGCERFCIPPNESYTHFGYVAANNGNSFPIWLRKTTKGYTAANGWRFNFKGVLNRSVQT